jgi:MFS transporter, PAT family, beta-lactamase induction signal transducer AmpG
MVIGAILNRICRLVCKKIVEGAKPVSEASQTVALEKRTMMDSIKPYLEKESIVALMLGISSGFPYAMIGATLTSRLAEVGIEKKTITAFSLAILVYNLKFLWAWIIDGVKLPVIGNLGQRVSWMLVTGLFVMAAVVNLAFVDPKADIASVVTAAILVGVAGASLDIVIDAYRIETLKPHQLGTGSGMSQYGWRIGSTAAGALALFVADLGSWSLGYAICALFALPAMLTALLVGEPPARKVTIGRTNFAQTWTSVKGPFLEFFKRQGALTVLLFILLHKIGDTLSQLTVRLLFNDMGYTKTEIAVYDVGVGFWAYLIGIFIGGIFYTKLGLKRSVLIALVLMAVSNLSFSFLYAAGKSNMGMAATMAFENIASGYGGVVVVAYFSALCDLRFTGAQFALISAGSSIVGRFLTGATAGLLIEGWKGDLTLRIGFEAIGFNLTLGQFAGLGYFNFYILTFFVAIPGIILFWWMMRAGLVDSAMGSVGRQAEDAQPQKA